MPHPFHWAPTTDLRHASLDTAPVGGGYRDGIVVETLCHRQVVVDKSVIGWLRKTCPECNEIAHMLAGTPMPPVSQSV